MKEVLELIVKSLVSNPDLYKSAKMLQMIL